jgi:hypothetical protein
MVPEFVELTYYHEHLGRDHDEGLVEVIDKDETHVWFRDDYAAVFSVKRSNIVKPRRFNTTKDKNDQLQRSYRRSS